MTESGLPLGFRAATISNFLDGYGFAIDTRGKEYFLPGGAFRILRNNKLVPREDPFSKISFQPGTKIAFRPGARPNSQELQRVSAWYVLPESP